MNSLLAVNVGNSQVALGVFGPPAPEKVPEPVFAASVPLPEGGVFLPRLPALPEFQAVILSSVNPGIEAAVLAWIERSFHLRVTRFPRDVSLPIENRYQPPEDAGADRLASAVAAYHEFRSATVIVDAGTAVTVNAVSGDGAFLGGAILPGPRLQLSALEQGTALLPRIESPEFPPAIGASTCTAIGSGVLRGIAGALDRLVADISEELGGANQVVITGGYASLFRQICHTKLIERPHIALAGLALSYSYRAGR